MRPNCIIITNIKHPPTQFKSSCSFPFPSPSNLREKQNGIPFLRNSDDCRCRFAFDCVPLSQSSSFRLHRRRNDLSLPIPIAPVTFGMPTAGAPSAGMRGTDCEEHLSPSFTLSLSLHSFIRFHFHFNSIVASNSTGVPKQLVADFLVLVVYHWVACGGHSLNAGA
ncbi:hypothetical protein TNCV_766401 [Trichonephila clavipes]|nr:hypothetical protein TNCV_766401 [Trichonephila clavipes]